MQKFTLPMSYIIFHKNEHWNLNNEVFQKLSSKILLYNGWLLLNFFQDYHTCDFYHYTPLIDKNKLSMCMYYESKKKFII